MRTSFKFPLLFIGLTFLWAAMAATLGDVGLARADDTQSPALTKSFQQRMEDARARAKANAEARKAKQPSFMAQSPILSSAKARAAGSTPTGINPAVDILLPNYANSPNLTKFVDSLPGLGINNPNNRGQYIPLAVPDTTTFPGSDYYVIGLADSTHKFHSELPAAKIRGYYQKNTGTAAGTDPKKDYLGGVIIAKRDRPVRLTFINELGPSPGTGDLFLPVDPTVMGAGAFNTNYPLPTSPLIAGTFTQNRADLHLHGGLTPWISDGTPHQWVTPSADPTLYKKGVSFQNVPDMVNGPTPCADPTGVACFTPALNDGKGT
jgi:hypothetical protein